MSRLVKAFKVLRNNWKKTVFFSGLAAWGVHYGHGKYLEFNLMKAYCESAKRFGDERLSPLQQPRHVTVILNPVANGRKGRAQYEKYCAPLFHLAGLKVSLVVTEAEGQAKELMEIMANTDCVVVAGGDGTVHEVITGLLRRPDSSQASQRFPIGIVPIGRNNFLANKLNSHSWDANVDTKAKILAESAMLVIKQTLAKVDVMKIEGERGRPVYSMGQVNFGHIRNVLHLTDQYWYLGQRMKPYLAFFFQSFKDLNKEWNEKKPIEVSYTEYCDGCSKCYQRFVDNNGGGGGGGSEVEIATQMSQRWWQRFLPLPSRKPMVADERRLRVERMKDVTNEQCDQWHTVSIEAKNVLIGNSIDKCRMQMQILRPQLARSEWIKEGVRICKNRPLTEDNRLFEVITAKQYCIHLQQEEEKAEVGKLFEQNYSTQPNEKDKTEVETKLENGYEKRWLSIDNESYEFQSKLMVTVLPERVKVYQ